MVARPEDWLRQAERDLAAAREAARVGLYEWACFAAQQAAEKAVKAVHRFLGNRVSGNSVSRMMAVLPRGVSPPPGLVDRAKELDQHYIPARYPSAHPGGAPADYYTREQAEGAIERAGEIVRWAREVVQAGP